MLSYYLPLPRIPTPNSDLFGGSSTVIWLRISYSSFLVGTLRDLPIPRTLYIVDSGVPFMLEPDRILTPTVDLQHTVPLFDVLAGVTRGLGGKTWPSLPRLSSKRPRRLSNGSGSLRPRVTLVRTIKVTLFLETEFRGEQFPYAVTSLVKTKSIRRYSLSFGRTRPPYLYLVLIPGLD